MFESFKNWIKRCQENRYEIEKEYDDLNKSKLRPQLFYNIRTFGFVLISLIPQIRGRTWDKDLCDDILSEAQDLVRFYANRQEVSKVIHATYTDIIALVENVNENDKETLNALASHACILWKDSQCLI